MGPLWVLHKDRTGNHFRQSDKVGSFLSPFNLDTFAEPNYRSNGSDPTVDDIARVLSQMRTPDVQPSFTGSQVQ